MKRCELGQKCPYQGQRQHLQEYYHSSTKRPPTQEEPLRPTQEELLRPTPKRKNPHRKARLAPTTPTTPTTQMSKRKKIAVAAVTINEQNDAYQETLALDALRKEESEMLAAIEISKQLIAISEAEQRANARKELEDQEPKTSPIIIQFRSPAGIIKRHFLPSDEWKDVVYRFMQCQEFGQTWKLVDPVDPSNPIIQTTPSQILARDGTVSDYGLSKLSFIVDLDD